MKSLFVFCVLAAVLVAAQCVDTSSQDKWVSAITQAMKELREDEKTLQILQKWIQQPSLPGNEKAQQELMVEALREERFDQIDVFEVEDVQAMKRSSKYFNTARESLKGSPIVVGTLKGTAPQQVTVDALASQQSATTKGRSLILNGHIDVVPEGDISQWKKSPWSGEYDQETKRIHGRGTTDMKGGIFSSLLAIKALRKMGVKLLGDIIFQSVIEEESGGAGTMATVLKGYKADGAIIPEPTNLKIFPKQQGSTWFRIKVKGVAAHGGTRYEGVSGIEKAFVVIEALGELEQKRNMVVLESDSMYKSFIARNISNPIPINIGKISGGKWPSSVADEVVLEGRLGVAPVETLDQAREQLKDYLIMQLPLRDAHFAQYPVSVEFFGGAWVPGSIEVTHDLNVLLSRAYKQITNEEPVIEASPWGTDAGYLTAHGTPAIVFGPGDTSMAHQTDETISLDNIYTCASVIARMMIDFCGVAASQ